MDLKIISRKLYLFQALLMKPDFNARLKLYITAVGNLGLDVTPEDRIPDEVDCADTVNTIHEKAFGFPIGGGASTYQLYQALVKSKLFKETVTPQEGDIVISPTGLGNGNLPNGHVGICGKDKVIMSNDSYTGFFSENYTRNSWRERYVRYGGFPMVFFTRI